MSKPFIASPIHTRASQKEKVSLITEVEQKDINLTFGNLQIIFEKKLESADWRLEVLNNEKPLQSQYSMIFSSKESISQIYKYLKENNISAFIEFIETKGESAMKISEYLREEMRNMGLKRSFNL